MPRRLEDIEWCFALCAGEVGDEAREVGDEARERKTANALGAVGLDFLCAGEQELLALIREHAERTGSPLAARILADWSAYRPKFVKVIPTRE